MTVVKNMKTDVSHTLDEQTDAGDFLTTCGDLLHKNFVMVSTDATAKADCPGCLTPQAKPLTAPSTGRGARQYRRPKNVHREMGESLKFAHVEIVAALEWLERGGDKQFLETSLDRTHLAFRFLKEILVEHKRIDPDPSPEDYDD